MCDIWYNSTAQLMILALRGVPFDNVGLCVWVEVGGGGGGGGLSFNFFKNLALKIEKNILVLKDKKTLSWP